MGTSGLGTAMAITAKALTAKALTAKANFFHPPSGRVERSEGRALPARSSRPSQREGDRDKNPRQLHAQHSKVN